MVKNLGDTIWVDFLVQTLPIPVNAVSFQVTLLDPSGAIRDTDANPTRIKQGKYEARLKIPRNGREGMWTVKIYAMKNDIEETESIKFYVFP